MTEEEPQDLTDSPFSPNLEAFFVAFENKLRADVEVERAPDMLVLRAAKVRKRIAIEEFRDAATPDVLREVKEATSIFEPTVTVRRL